MTNSTLTTDRTQQLVGTAHDDRRASQSTGADGAAAAAAVQSLPITQFIFGAGIECSFIPHLNVDQFQWTQHNRFWRDDFRLAKDELGVSHLRYAFPWHV